MNILLFVVVVVIVFIFSTFYHVDRIFNERYKIPIQKERLRSLAQEISNDMYKRSLDENQFKRGLNKVEKRAVVTYFKGSDKYFYGTMALMESLILTKTNAERIILAHDSITSTQIAKLKALGHNVTIVPSLKFDENIFNDIPQNWLISTEKMRVLGMEEYDKIIFMDSDTLALKNLDDMFELPSFSMVRDPGPDKYNAGIMVFKPSKILFDKFIKFINDIPNMKNLNIRKNDQAILGKVLENEGKDHFLCDNDGPCKYHGFYHYCQYENTFDYPYIIHFLANTLDFMKWADPHIIIGNDVDNDLCKIWMAFRWRQAFWSANKRLLKNPAFKQQY